MRFARKKYNATSVLLAFITFFVLPFEYFKPPSAFIAAVAPKFSTFSPQTCKGQIGESPLLKSNVPVAHVAVVVRMYNKHLYAAGSLIKNLQSSALCNDDFHVDVTFFIVMTDGSPRTRDAAKMLQNSNRDADIRIVELPVNLFVNVESLCPPWDAISLKERSAWICTVDDSDCMLWILTLSNTSVFELYKRTCSYPNKQHYIATDLGLSDAIACITCTHVLVTNADNHYLTTFLPRMITSSVLTMCWFYNNGHPPGIIETTAARTQVDLGAVVVSLDFLRRNPLSFISSLPKLSHPRHFHDNDWWFVHKLVFDLNATYSIVKTVEFMHL